MSEVVQQMFSSIAHRYDLANDVLSFGSHRSWKKQAIKQLGLTAGEKVLDVCTGTGDLAFTLAEAVGPSGAVVGVDFSPSMLARAEKKAGKKKNERDTNLLFMKGDALNLPFKSDSFDAVTIAFGIRNLDDSLSGLKEFFRLLKPAGKLLVLEFGQPKVPVYSQLYCWYSKYLMPRIGGILTGNKEAYEYLPKTASQYPCREQFIKLMEEAGFKENSYQSLQLGIAYMYSGRKT